MNCYRNHFDMITNAVLALLMGLFMGIAMLIINHTTITWVSLLDIWADITLIVTVVLIFIPLNGWGNSFAAFCKCKKGTAAHILIENAIPTLVINTVLSAIIPAMEIFYNDHIPKEDRVSEWIGLFIGGWPLTFVISFVLSIIAVKIGKTIAQKTLDTAA